MLVASFVGVEKSLELYEEAIAKEYKFYSYGDAMLII
jgi:S-adenosylmethionine:tRNA ribosyltransferase-isomerase